MRISYRIWPVANALAALVLLPARPSLAQVDETAGSTSQDTQGQTSAESETIYIEADAPRQYSLPEAASITGLPARLRELPATVNIVSEAFVEDTSARRLRDLVGYVPGVYGMEVNGGTGDQVMIAWSSMVHTRSTRSISGSACISWAVRALIIGKTRRPMLITGSSSRCRRQRTGTIS